MRKLKLQMQTTLDGFVAGQNGELDWMTFKWDKPLEKLVNDLTDSSDTIILGRKMTDGFVSYWTSVTQDSIEYDFAQKMNNTPKVVFTKTLDESPWPNTSLAKGDLVDEINALKNTTGKDIVVYGGATFVSSLLDANLIDELNIFVNPVAIGEGMRAFNGRQKLKLVDSTKHDCGIVVNKYVPVQ